LQQRQQLLLLLLPSLTRVTVNGAAGGYRNSNPIAQTFAVCRHPQELLADCSCRQPVIRDILCMFFTAKRMSSLAGVSNMICNNTSG
jgi:hypothetical protein